MAFAEVYVLPVDICGYCIGDSIDPLSTRVRLRRPFVMLTRKRTPWGCEQAGEELTQHST